MAAYLRVVVGTAVLLMGRKLYWLFVGGAGFALGSSLATRFLADQPTWVVVLVALAAGVGGALLATLLQRAAIALSGFASAGYVALSLANALGWGEGWLAWLAFVVGGIIGGILVLAAFDWALIILSTLTGASLIVQAIGLPLGPRTLLFVLLTTLGILVQVAMLQRDQRSRETR